MFATAVDAADVRAPAPLELVQTIPLADVRGRIDHLAIDADGARLFVAALGNDSVEVIDLGRGTRVARINRLHEPQGIGYVRSANRLFVANAGGGVDLFDASTLRRVSRIEGLDDADNVRVDAVNAKVFVGFAHALAALDPASGKLLERIALEGHPESFQLESTGSRIFVNVPSAAHIAVVDSQKKSVVGTWRIGHWQANFPMALDEAGRRLFVGCRQPSKLLVLDTESGKEAASVECSGDTDDVFYDAKRKRIYVTCGEGVLDVIRQEGRDRYARVQRIQTAAGARTGLFVPELDRLYLAVPHRNQQPAEIRVYEVQNP